MTIRVHPYTACVCSVSDKHKQLLLKSPRVFTQLTLGLFVDPEHPQLLNSPPPLVAPAETQAIYQRNYSEALQQLALFPAGREALLQEASVLKALEEVADAGMTPEAQAHAQGALLALSDKQIVPDCSDAPQHVMLSYSWSEQPMILRIHSSLCTRGYLVWIDTEMMKGSTMDAMSEAIEGADVVCYGVSLA